MLEGYFRKEYSLDMIFSTPLDWISCCFSTCDWFLQDKVEDTKMVVRRMKDKQYI
jgi:hypothetical protein